MNKQKTRNVLWLLPFVFYLFTLKGCVKESALEKARDASSRAKEYYASSVKQYQDAITQGKDTQAAHFELGKLYYSHGDFKKATEELKHVALPEAKKLRAIAQYQLGNFTDALTLLNELQLTDSEYFYYKGLTSEKLNLFDQALDIYMKIKGGSFAELAKVRINAIEKQALGSPLTIESLNPSVATLVKSAPPETQYPQAGGLILLSDEKVEVTAQNTEISELHYVIKIFNERGKEDFSEAHIDYDSTFEKVELEYARTIKPDGTVVEVGDRHIRDVSKYLNFPLYSNARVRIISFPEITEGASVEYKVKIYRSQLINKKDFVLPFSLQSSQPIKDAYFTLTVPKKRLVYFKILNDDYNTFGAKVSPAVKHESDKTVYRWEFKNIPEMLPESNMPPSVSVNPAILISTFSSWQEIYDWWWGLAKDKIKADDAIKQKVAELIAEADTQEAKAQAICNFVAAKIRYVAVEYGQAGYEPHKAEDIFKNKYGDCKDQAVLLVTMLHEAGITAWPVLIPTNEYFNLQEDFPSMLFNHAIAAVFLGEKIIFVDATAETCNFGDLPPADQNRKVLICKDTGYQKAHIPLFSPEHNVAEQIVTIKVDTEESIEADKSIVVTGMYDQAQRYWLLYSPPELVKEYLGKKVQDICIGASVDSVNIDNLDDLRNPVVLKYHFRGREYFTRAGKLRFISQPELIDSALVSKETRKYPIEFNALDTKRIVYAITLPAGFSAVYVPKKIQEESPWMEYTCEYIVQDRYLTFNQKIIIKKQTISQKEYPAFKQYYERLAKYTKEKIVLERK